MRSDSRRQLFLSILFPFALSAMACLVGCQSQSPVSPVGGTVIESPEAALLRLLSDPGRDLRTPLAQTTSEQASPTTRSLGHVSFIDLWGATWTLQIVGTEYVTPQIAKVYATYAFLDPIFAGNQANITFLMILVEDRWRLDDIEFTALPPVLPVGGLGVQGRIVDAVTGRPIENAAVGLYQGEILINSTLTDATGFYFLTAPAPGSFTVTASKDGYEFLTRTEVYIF